MGTLKKKKIKAQSQAVPLFSDIYRTLLHEIFRGNLRPGTLITEEALAARFGVSRTPIREALSHLINDGFLEKGAFRSYLVVDISIQSIKDLYDLRFLLEPAAAAQAAANPLRMNALSRAERVVEEMRASLPEGKDIEQLLVFSELDARFHESIAEASGNKRMMKFVAELTKHNQRFWMLLNSKGAALATTVQEHCKILAALREGDQVKAGNALREHLAKSRERLKL